MAVGFLSFLLSFLIYGLESDGRVGRLKDILSIEERRSRLFIYLSCGNVDISEYDRPGITAIKFQ